MPVSVKRMSRVFLTVFFKKLIIDRFYPEKDRAKVKINANRHLLFIKLKPTRI